MKAPLLISALGALALASSLAGCGDEAPAPVAAAPAAPRKAPVAAPAPAAAGLDGGIAAPVVYQYAYNPLGKRDPFRGFQEDPKGPGEPGGGGQCNEPLCQYDIESLSLVAVVSGDANPLAMVEDPAQTGHLVRRNTRIGKQSGKVTQILRDCIIVTEYWTGPDGKSNPNPVKICVKSEKAEAPPTDLMNPQKRVY